MTEIPSPDGEVEILFSPERLPTMQLLMGGMIVFLVGLIALGIVGAIVQLWRARIRKP